MVLCRFYQQGYCRYGANCRFEHSSGFKHNRNEYYEQPQQQQQQPPPPPRRFETSNRFTAFNDDYKSKDYSQTRKTFPPTNASVEAQMTFEDFVVTTIREIGISSNSQKQWPLSCFGPLKESDNYPGLEDVSPEEWRWECIQSQQQGTLHLFIQRITQMINSQETILNEIRSQSSGALMYLRKIYQGQKIDSQSQSQSFSFNRLNDAQTPNIGFQQTVFGNASMSPPNAMNNSFQPPEAKPFGSPFSSVSAFGSTSQPILSSPNQPILSSPNQPILSSPNQPILSSPNQPILSSPNQPILSSPNQPILSSPNQPILQSPSQPIFGLPQNPQIQNSSAIAGFSSTATSAFQNPTNSPHSFSAINTSIETPSAFSSTGRFNSSAIAPNISSTNAHLYSKLEDLTVEEREQFAAQSFTLGKIPTKPPPLELC